MVRFLFIMLVFTIVLRTIDSIVYWVIPFIIASIVYVLFAVSQREA